LVGNKIIKRSVAMRLKWGVAMAVGRVGMRMGNNTTAHQLMVVLVDYCIGKQPKHHRNEHKHA